MKRKSKTALAGAFALALICGASALTANIQPSDPDDVTLNGTNGYDVDKTFDGTASTGSVSSYSWDLVDASQSTSGPEAEFTFDTGVAASNTIRLTVSNGTHSDVDEVTQVVHDKPKVSISANTTSIDSGEAVKFTSSVTNNFDGPVSYDWKVDGSSKGSSSSFTTTFSSDSSVNLKVTDQAGESATSSTKSITVSSGNNNNNDDGEDQSSDDGNTGAVSSNSNDPAEKTHIFSTVEAGEKAEVSIEEDRRESIGVSKVSVTVENRAEDVEITVEQEEGKPDAVSEEVPGSAYNYMRVDAKNLEESDVRKAEIQFEVNRSWIENQDIDSNTVTLRRYHENEWQALDTRLQEDSGEEYSYTAETPGFSYFAVSGDREQDRESETEESDNVTKDPEEDSEARNQTGQTEEGNESESPGDKDGRSGALLPAGALPALLLPGLVIIVALLYREF